MQRTTAPLDSRERRTGAAAVRSRPHPAGRRLRVPGGLRVGATPPVRGLLDVHRPHVRPRPRRAGIAGRGRRRRPQLPAGARRRPTAARVPQRLPSPWARAARRRRATVAARDPLSVPRVGVRSRGGPACDAPLQHGFSRQRRVPPRRRPGRGMARLALLQHERRRAGARDAPRQPRDRRRRLPAGRPRARSVARLRARRELEDRDRELLRVLPLLGDPSRTVQGDPAGLRRVLSGALDRCVDRRSDGAAGSRGDDVAHGCVRRRDDPGSARGQAAPGGLLRGVSRTC